jgi:hypothetical protein
LSVSPKHRSAAASDRLERCFSQKRISRTNSANLLCATFGAAAIPDLVVANSRSNTVTMLPGGGGRFLDDRNPRVLPSGIDPQQVLLGHFLDPNELDLVTINAGSNDLTFFRDFGPGQDIGSGIASS